MFLHESSRQPSNNSRKLSQLEELLLSVGEIRLLSSDIRAHGDEKVYPLTGYQIKVACHADTDANTVFKLCETIKGMLSASDNLAKTSAALVSRDSTLSLISSTMIHYSESNLSHSQFIQSLLPDSKYAIFKAGELLLNNQFTPLALGSCKTHLEKASEGSVRVLDGELYFYKSDPYELLIESAEPIPTPFKALINLYLSQIGDRERQTLRENAERKSRDMERLANQDPLTHLANRRGLTQYTESLLNERSHDNATHAVLHLDLDYFKNVNDTLGHAIGDELLIKVARILQSQIRHQDIAARIGGDEFLVLCPFVGDLNDISKLATTLIQDIGRPHQVEEQTCQIGASIGIALCEHKQGTDVARWMEDADLALYRSKDNGREQFCWYDDSLREAGKFKKAG